MTKTMRRALGLMLCLLLCVCLLPAAYADGEGAATFAELKQAIASGESYFNMIDCGTVVFTESITLPETLHIEARDTNIVIPDRVTLTVEGFANLGSVTVQSGGHVTVNDTDRANFAVHQGLRFDSVDQFTVNGHMYVTEGVWTDELCGLNLGPNAGVAVAHNVNDQQQFNAAAGKFYNFPNNKFEKLINVNFNWELTHNFGIKDYSVSIGGSWSDGQPHGSLTIPEGVTLTISDKLSTEDAPVYLNGTLVNLGILFITRDKSDIPLLVRGENGTYSGRAINVFAPVDQRDACLSGFDLSKFTKNVGLVGTSYFPPESGGLDGLKKAIKNGESSYQLVNDEQLLIEEDLEIPANFELSLIGTDMFVDKRATLTVNGRLSLWQDAHLFNNSCLVNNNFIGLGRRSQEETNALLHNAGRYAGAGEIAVQDTGDNSDRYIFGLNLGLFNKSEAAGGVHYAYDPSGLLDSFKQACEKGEAFFDLHNAQDVTLSESLRIPSTMQVRADGTRLTVPENEELNIEGQVWTDELTVRGRLNVMVSGALNAGTLNADGYGYFEGTVTGNILNIGSGRSVILNEVHYGDGTPMRFPEIHYGENAGILFNHSVNTQQELSDAVAAAAQPHDEHVDEFIRVMFPWTVSADMGIPLGDSLGDLQVFAMNGLTVEEGAVLTVDGVLNCASKVVIDGAIVNKGRICMSKPQDISSGAALRVNGSYSGFGDLSVNDAPELADAYFSGIDTSRFEKYNMPGNVYYGARGLIVDIALPENVRSLEKEALSGGRFRTVYIPENAESIDPEAFAGLRGLIIYGAAGSSAETFAGNSGFRFVALP